MHIQSVWEKMLEGNRRYAAELQSRADVSAQKRRDTIAAQHPCAAVVACSDSRVPVEYLFDMGVGELFVIRVAGNVVGTHEAESLEHAVKHLHVPLVLILGHTGCEAVSAALSGNGTGSIMKKIEPAVRRARAHNQGKSAPELLHAACIENIHQAIADLLNSSPTVNTAAATGMLTIAGALYDIKTGEVAGLDA